MRLIVLTSCLVLLAVLIHTDHVTAAPGGSKGKQKGGAKNIGPKDRDSKSGESSEESRNKAPAGEVKPVAPAPDASLSVAKSIGAAAAPAPAAAAPAPEAAAAAPAPAPEPEQVQEPPPDF